MSTTAPDLWSSISTGWADATQQWVDQSQSMWDQVIASYPAVRASAAPGDLHGQHRHGHHAHDDHDHRHHDHDHRHDSHDSHDSCRCDSCRCDSCGDPSHHHSHDDCHSHDGCHCRDACDCCVPESDIVLHTRIGERRVIPFRLRNPWRREREVTLGIGPWHVCGDSDLVVVAVLEAEKVVLGPCEDRIVRLLVGATVSLDNGGDDGNGGGDNNGGDNGGDNNGDDNNGDGKGDNNGNTNPNANDNGDTYTGTGTTNPGLNNTRIGRDLEGCASAYADVRFEGCARPQRVAVVVSPARCDPFDVPCDCGCCC